MSFRTQNPRTILKQVFLWIDKAIDKTSSQNKVRWLLLCFSYLKDNRHQTNENTSYWKQGLAVRLGNNVIIFSPKCFVSDALNCKKKQCNKWQI